MAFSNGKGRGAKYGAEHQAERRQRLTYVKPGDPCSHCGLPLPSDTSTWHLPHTPDGRGYMPGMQHGSCNVREGAQRGARIVNARRNRATVKKPAVKGRRLTW